MGVTLSPQSLVSLCGSLRYCQFFSFFCFLNILWQKSNWLFLFISAVALPGKKWQTVNKEDFLLCSSPVRLLLFILEERKNRADILCYHQVVFVQVDIISFIGNVKAT